jgi:hypothetical protein
LLKTGWRGWRRVGVLVVVVLHIVLNVVGGDTVPCVGHLIIVKRFEIELKIEI